MRPRAAIGGLAVIWLVGGAIFLAWGAFRGGTMALPAAIAFIMLSLLSSTMYQAFIQVEARLKALEERLAKCERTTASAS